MLKRDQVMTLATGEKLILPRQSYFATEAYVSGGTVDWGSEPLLYRMMSGAGAFLDVGANIGYYSLYMRGKASGVFAFEPDPRPRAGLERNVADKPDIEIIPLCVGREVGTVKFVQAASNEVSHIATSHDAADSIFEVRATTIDEFVRRRNIRVEAIKTDVEGFDLEALKGARTTLKEQRPIVLSELGVSDELLELTQDVDYSVFGYVRDRESREISFLASSQIGPQFVTKMLFLIPREKAAQLREAA